MKNPVFSFSKRRIEQLPTPAKERALYRDSEVKGLVVTVQPVSGSRAFSWYRWANNKPVWAKIGNFGDITVEQARAVASGMNSRLAMGEEPIEKKPEDLAGTLSEAFEKYVTLHIRAHSRKPEDAEYDVRWLYGRYLAGLAKRPVSSLTRPEVSALKHKLLETYGPYAANRALELLRAVYNYLIRENLFAGPNPAEDFGRLREEKRTRFLQPEEKDKFFAELEKADEDLRDFVLLSLMTGARKSDVLAMRWADLYGTGSGEAKWSVPATTKTGMPYNIPLLPDAAALLKARRIRVPKECPWVFPSPEGRRSRTGHLLDLKKSWERFRKLAGVPDLRQHDLRRTLGSYQAIQGTSLPVIAKSLGHNGTAATEVYARLSLDPIRASVAAAYATMRALPAPPPKRKRK